ncbi:malate dehydrogenase, glyoxysomal [Tanacetum coccineum]
MNEAMGFKCGCFEGDREQVCKIEGLCEPLLASAVVSKCVQEQVSVTSLPIGNVPVETVSAKAFFYNIARASGTGNHEVIDATIVGRLIDPQEGLDPRDVSVPVVRGRVGVTILPLLSQVKPSCSFTEKEIKYLTKRIQDGGTDVVQLLNVVHCSGMFE